MLNYFHHKLIIFINSRNKISIRTSSFSCYYHRREYILCKSHLFKKINKFSMFRL